MELAIEALSKDAYEELVIDKLKVHQVAITCINSKMNFSWVAEDENGNIQGALGALIVPHMFYKHNQAMIVMWYCKIPGDGKALMKEFLAWCSQKKTVTMIEYTGENGDDPRISALVKRMGLVHEVPAYFGLRKAGNESR